MRVEVGRQATTELQDALWRLMRGFGWGTVRRVEGLLGWTTDKLHRARERGMTLDEIFAVLKVLEVPRRSFFLSVFGDGPTLAGDRFRFQGATLLARAEAGRLPDFATPTCPDALSAAELEALDCMRFEAPRAAIKRARAMALSAGAEGRRGDAVACIARMGSALRVAEKWHAAHAAVAWAINRAPAGPILADCWLRAASVTSDYGEFADAVELARLALLTFLELDDDDGQGRALILLGIFLRRDGDPQGAIQCLRSALAKLPEDERRNRFVCHINSGAASLEVGDLRTAGNHAREAGAVGVSAAWLVQLQWLRARIATARGDLAQAVSLYERTIARLDGSPGDVALVGAELARVQLQAKRPADAVETALTLGTMAFPGRSNRVVASAIRDLSCSAATGQLRVDMIDRIIKRIRRGRNRRAVAIGHRT